MSGGCRNLLEHVVAFDELAEGGVFAVEKARIPMADEELAAGGIGIAKDEVMAVGDNLNDLEMLEFAGTGVVMGNAEPSLHDIDGLHHTGTNDQDGVAIAIERFILNAEVSLERLGT